jgi:hypothetical protein
MEPDGGISVIRAKGQGGDDAGPTPRERSPLA